jgi:hypothetical protein
VRPLWEHVLGDSESILALFSGVRSEPGSKSLEDARTVYVNYPRDARRAEELCYGLSEEGREVYSCAHLLTARRRIKTNAAPLMALYVDGDGAKVGDDIPEPTAVVRSSPGREQFWWRLSRSVSPFEGERLNRRLAYAMGADRSGWDLTQLLRVPGTRNHKYPDAPLVELASLSETRYDPAQLDAVLPKAPEAQEGAARRSTKPRQPLAVPDLSRLSNRTRELVMFGNCGQYASRSDADFAACLGMFGAGFEEAEVWAAMTDPTHGISEKFFEKGRDGERYLALTIGKAMSRAKTPAMQGKTYVRRKAVVSIG